MKIDGQTIFTEGENYVTMSESVVTAAAAYTVASQYIDTVFCDTATTAAFTVTIPSAFIAIPGYSLKIVDSGDGNFATANLTVATAGSETINGAATLVLATDNVGAKIVSDGTNLFASI